MNTNRLNPGWLSDADFFRENTDGPTEPFEVSKLTIKYLKAIWLDIGCEKCRICNFCATAVHRCGALREK